MSPNETFVFYETTDLRSVPARIVTSQRTYCQSWREGQTFPISWEFFDTIVIYVNKQIMTMLMTMTTMMMMMTADEEGQLLHPSNILIEWN